MLALVFSSSTVCFGIVIYASKKNNKFTELLGVSLMLPTLVTVWLASFTDVFAMDIENRSNVTKIYCIIYLISAQFTSNDFFPHLIVR